MKTYYDLTSKEKKAFLDEFKKTPGGKNIFITQIIVNFLFSLLSLILTFEYSESIFSYYLFILFIPLVYDIYVDIMFSCWLKNKHNIRRW